MLGIRCAVVAACLALASVLFAQNTPPKVELRFDKIKPIAGTVVKGTLIVTFGDGLHAYQNPPSLDYQIPIKVSAPKGLKLTKVTYPKGVAFLMAGETTPSMVYQDKIEIPVQIKLPAKVGKTSIKLMLDYQQCTDSNCFPPDQVSAEAKLTVLAAPKRK